MDKHYKMAWAYWIPALFTVFWLPPEASFYFWIFVGLCLGNIICMESPNE